jgi:hypothetical protein
MPIRPDSIKPPANLVPRTFVPVNGHKHPVAIGESWVSLAATVGWSPWDLIRYNYPTLPADLQLASKEVNWYLQNYVGCTLLTPDQRNYRFSPPGEIWLPLTPDQLARNLVLSTLRGPAVRRMTFGVGFLIILSAFYEDVAKAIEAGKIVVKAKSGHIALYHGYLHPALIEVDPALGDLGLILHECTHAIFDMRKITTRVEQSEAFGYLAQALYGWLVRGGAPPNRYLVSRDPADLLSWVSWQLIFDESTRLAGILARKYWVSEDDAALLFKVIPTANIYRSRAGKVETNDGV